MRGLDMDAAGMQQLVDTIRETGATNVIMVAGVSYGNDLSQWLKYAPKDPLQQLAASVHIFNYHIRCNKPDCLHRTLSPIMEKFPLIVAEYGTTECDDGFVDTVQDWIDETNLSHFIANSLDCDTLKVDYRGLCACSQ